MSLNNTTKSRFISRASEYSTRGSRTGVNLLGWEEPENLSDTETRECLAARQRFIDEQLRLLKKGDPERSALIDEKLGLEERLSVLNKVIGRYSNMDMSDHMLKIFKERVSKFEWERVVKEARSRMAESDSHEH